MSGPGFAVVPAELPAAGRQFDKQALKWQKLAAHIEALLLSGVPDAQGEVAGALAGAAVGSAISLEELAVHTGQAAKALEAAADNYRNTDGAVGRGLGTGDKSLSTRPGRAAGEPDGAEHSGGGAAHSRRVG